MTRYLIIAAILFTSCHLFTTEKQTEEGNVVQDVRIINPASDISGCYTAVLERDTANLVLQHKPDAASVSGDLEFNNFETDGNYGTINGIIKGDRIVAYYRYFSEGMESIRQVVFKIENNRLLEGYGEIIESRDTTFFKDMDQINFLTEKPFLKRDCD